MGLMKTFLWFSLFTLFGVFLWSGFPSGTAQAQSGGRTTLALLDGDGDLTILGIMRTESVCDVVASRLNYYANLPPRDADRFYCRYTY